MPCRDRRQLSKPVEINKGIRQGCPLSPTMFNVYLYAIITKWQNQDITGTKLSNYQQLSTLLSADDQVITADTEDNLQKAAHKLNNNRMWFNYICTENKMDGIQRARFSEN
jgi:hypothetical protein